MAVCNIGDCYVEMNEMDKAVGQFEKAADMVKSDFTTPMYLMKAGILHKQAGNWKAAAKAFRRVANDFPQHSDVNQAKKYAAMAEALAAAPSLAMRLHWPTHYGNLNHQPQSLRYSLRSRCQRHAHWYRSKRMEQEHHH